MSADYDELLDLGLPQTAPKFASLAEAEIFINKLITSIRLLNQGKHALLPFSTGAATLPISSTNYIGCGTVGATAASAHFAVTHDCKVRKLRVNTSANIVGSVTYTLFVNGVASGIAVTLSGANSSASELVTSVQLYAGDTVCIRAVTDGTAAVVRHQITLGV